MDSKEFGLVAAQQLFQVEDLHYGFWDSPSEATLNNWKSAQEKHTNFLFDYIFDNVKDIKESKLLDIGCGIGITTKKLLEKGYNVDGLVPYSWMADYARKIISKSQNSNQIYECNFEDFPVSSLKEKYQLVFFSESFQYVNLMKSFDVLNNILEKDGIVIIFDFFKKDNIDGISPLGGGHSLGSFYNTAEKYGYKIISDLDVTKNLSPNLKLVNKIIVNRLIPFSSTLDKFMKTRNKTIYTILKWLLKKRINKLSFKYSSDRNEANFIKFKTYRLIVLSKDI